MLLDTAWDFDSASNYWTEFESTWQSLTKYFIRKYPTTNQHAFKSMIENDACLSTFRKQSSTHYSRMHGTKQNDKEKKSHGEHNTLPNISLAHFDIVRLVHSIGHWMVRGVGHFKQDFFDLQYMNDSVWPRDLFCGLIQNKLVCQHLRSIYSDSRTDELSWLTICYRRRRSTDEISNVLHLLSWSLSTHILCSRRCEEQDAWSKELESVKSYPVWLKQRRARRFIYSAWRCPVILCVAKSAKA